VLPAASLRMHAVCCGAATLPCKVVVVVFHHATSDKTQKRGVLAHSCLSIIVTNRSTPLTSKLYSIHICTPALTHAAKTTFAYTHYHLQPYMSLSRKNTFVKSCG